MVDIRKTAQLYDEHRNDWHDIYEVKGVGGTTITVLVPREIRDPGNLRKNLLSQGAELPTLDLCKGELAAAAEMDAPLRTRAGRTGYRGDNCFVGHRWVAGGDKSVLPPAPSLIKNAGEIALRGTLEGWQKVIADVVPYSTGMIFALCLPFAAYLLTPTRSQNVGFILVGGSRSGKTSAQIIAASVIGLGSEEHLPTLAASKAGLLEAGLVFNDHLLPINEVATADGKKQDTHVAVKRVTYALISGKDVIRHSSWSGHSSTSSSFKVIVLLSSERSPDEWAEQGGETREDGETARLIAVPVVFDGHDTILDLMPELYGEERDRWLELRFTSVHTDLPEQTGVVGRDFLRAFLAGPLGFTTRARQDIDKFVNNMRKRGTSPIRKDIIAKFGEAYAGGMAAVRSGHLPLDAKTVGPAIQRCCWSALDSLPEAEADLRSGLATLALAMEAGGIIDADEASTSQKQNLILADGFHAKQGVGRIYVFRATSFMKIFRSLALARRVLEWLDDQGLLLHQRERKAGRSNEWAQRQIDWPDDSRVRSITIYIASTLEVLNLEI